MADNLDFESFDNLDDLDWSALEKDIKDTSTQKAPAPGGGEGAAAAPAAAFPSGHAAKAPSGEPGKIDINYLLDVNLQVTVEVGRRQVYISQLLAWAPGSIVELDKLVGEPLNLLVNSKPVAKGEVVVVNDKFAIKIVSILDPRDRLAYLSH
jgi:flagellar motor switch protein FliN/FliY